MTIDLLVTTMKQTDFSLIEKMNIRGNAIISNQCDEVSLREKEINGKHIYLLSTNTRGKSINQNIALMFSQADIVLFADDDMVLSDDYEELVLSFFERHPEADAVKFYCESTNPDRPLSFKRPDREKRIGKFGIMSAGTPMLAVKKEFLQKNNIFFDTSIGPGTQCSNGEDSVFFSTLCKKSVKLYISPNQLAQVKQDTSSWFDGLDERFFINTGIIYRKLYGIWSEIFIIRRALICCLKKKTNLSFFQMISLMNKGGKDK